MSFTTVKKAYIVTKLGFRQGERFKTLEDAKMYAEQIAKRTPYETLEIFECKYNLAAELPVVYYGEK
jgi:hypothetical protein